MSIIALSLFTAVKVFAQDTMISKYPCAVLLQLSSEHNRITALTRAHRAKEIEQVTTDAVAVQNAMLNDFKENFHYCPVYFFLDTNANLIRNKQFVGTLMTPDGVPVERVTPCIDSARYLVMYYGTPSSQSRQSNTADADNSYGTPAGRGLVILNENFTQISYIYKLGTAELFGEAKKKKNYYSSPRFDIEYYPLASRFDERLRERKNQTDKIKIGK
jgi:hypothetical protein